MLFIYKSANGIRQQSKQLNWARFLKLIIILHLAIGQSSLKHHNITRRCSSKQVT